MIYRFCLAGLLFITLSGFSQNAKVTSSSCDNVDFENGDLTNWTLETGYPSDDGTTFGWTPGPIKNHITGIQNGDSITNGGYDSIVGGTQLPKVCPGGNFSFLLGNRAMGSSNGNNGVMSPSTGRMIYGDASRITYNYLVTSERKFLTIKYAVVLFDPNLFIYHAQNEFPYFKVFILDQNNDTIGNSPCSKISDLGCADSVPGCHNLLYAGLFWKNWSTYYVDLSQYVGQAIRVQFIAADCTQGGHFTYAYIDASCDPAKINVMRYNCDSIILKAPQTREEIKYVWAGPGIVGPIQTQNEILVNSPGKYTVYMYNSNFSCFDSVETTITAGSPMIDFNYQYISPQKVNFHDSIICPLDIPSSFFWDFGDGQTSTQSDPSHTYSSAGTYTVTLTVHSQSGGVDSVSKNIVISTSTSINENAGINNLNYYTDPNSETHIVFSTPKDQRIILEIYDMLGQVIQKKELYLSKGKNDLLLNTSAISAGLYIVSLQKQNFISVVIEK